MIWLTMLAPSHSLRFMRLYSYFTIGLAIHVRLTVWSGCHLGKLLLSIWGSLDPRASSLAGMLLT
jgi:hypothetical protein